MNFLKRLFSFNKKEQKEVSKQENKEIPKQEEKPVEIEEFVLDGSLKMIGSYFMDNQVENKIKSPINHPINLDQVVEDGMGYQMYCKAMRMDDNMTVISLAMAFSAFMVEELGFKFFKDQTPENQLRAMTLKYDKNGVVLSLYPLEYALKVLNYESTFEDLYNRVKSNLEALPKVDDILDGLTDPKEDE